ncbi:MAG: DUF4838 domain-containing protein [Armatimonadota bacterium]|nr:MAG: DUF4838 domain-containing protein [Armatimonadota bacterium]
MMKRIVTMMIVATMAGGAGSAGTGVQLVKDGRAVCSVMLPREPTAGERAAADELRAYLSRMSGAEVPLGSTMPTRIVLGRAASFEKMPFAVPQLQSEYFLMRTHAGDLYLIGADEAAVSHAVYTLLRDLGCRWFMPGDIGKVVPQRSDITVGPCDRIEGPDFNLRSMWYAWSSSDPENTPAARARFAEWCRRNRTGGAKVGMGHNLVHGPLPPDTYLRDHPEYYALVDGVRKPTQPCTSNPAVIDIVAREVIRYFDDNPDAVSYSLSPEDNAEFCQCANCTALDSGLTDPGFSDYPVVTDRLVRFYNAVAERVQEKHPGKCVAFYAYFNHTLPPTTVKLHPNVLVSVTAQQFCTVHSVTDRHCASRRKMAGIIEEYARQTDYVYVREYDPMPGSAELPTPLFGAHLRDMPWYKRVGVRGFSWESHKSWATLMPNHYVLAEMMWDADQDPDALLADFYDAFFGPAAAPMRRYYEALEMAFARSEAHPGWGTREFPAIFTDEILSHCRAALREARPRARNSPYRERVRMVAFGLAYLESWLNLKRAVAGADYEAAVAARDRTLRLLDTLSGVNGDFVSGSEARGAITRDDNELGWILPYSRQFRRNNDVIAELPKLWRFRREADELESSAWAGADYNDSAWGMISTDSQWWEQVSAPLENCRAWVRVSFAVPDAFRNRRIILRLGALDEEGWLYVNGALVHRRMAEGENWAEPFEVDITHQVRLGERNVLAVRAQAETTLGGVWRGAVIYSPSGR